MALGASPDPCEILCSLGRGSSSRVDRSQNLICINNIPPRSQDFPSRKTREEIISLMLKFNIVTTFYLLALVLSVLATPTSTPTPEFRTEEVEYGEMDGSQHLGDGDIPLFFSYSEKLYNWSYCNYSSKEGCARGSVVRWGGKYYDPLSFKGAENDTYGKLHSKKPYWS
jgi:hypothetical protein